MEMMTSRWTDDRMDDLKHQVDELGRRMEVGFTEQRSEMNARFDRLEKSLEARFEKVDERFDKIDERFEKVDERFEVWLGKIVERFEKADGRFEVWLGKIDDRFERVDAKFDGVNEQIARTQEMVIGLHATLTRFSLGFLGAAIVAVIAALLAS
jgi:archaellum component FlaC